MSHRWFRREKRRFEDSYHAANLVAGVCDALSLGQVGDLLEHAEKVTKRAKEAAAFANSAGALGDAGEKVALAAEK